MRLLTILFILASTVAAEALDYRWAIAGGFGGTGLKKKESVNGGEVNVERSEGPGMMAISVETLLTDDVSLAFEHARGFRLAPFSTGMGFTGFAGRWYFDSAAPAVALANSQTKSILLVRRFVPFAGGSVGLATGEISRDDDQVRSVSASGIYFGFRGGADYQYLQGIIFRPEIFYSMSLSSFRIIPRKIS